MELCIVFKYRKHKTLILRFLQDFRSRNRQFDPMKKERHWNWKKKLEDMVELDKMTRVEDVAWICSLSESEIDMLISLKLLIIQRAERIGCKKLANKFDLKILRAIALVLMEHLKAEVKDSSLIPDVKSAAFLDACNLLKCNDEVVVNIEELSTYVGADIQSILTNSSTSKLKKQKFGSRE